MLKIFYSKVFHHQNKRYFFRIFKKNTFCYPNFFAFLKNLCNSAKNYVLVKNFFFSQTSVSYTTKYYKIPRNSDWWNVTFYCLSSNRELNYVRFRPVAQELGPAATLLIQIFSFMFHQIEHTRSYRKWCFEDFEQCCTSTKKGTSIWKVMFWKLVMLHVRNIAQIVLFDSTPMISVCV
jgi:hypothetical protein